MVSGLSTRGSDYRYDVSTESFLPLVMQAHWVSLNLRVLDFKFLNVTAVTGFAMLWGFHGGSDGKESACSAGDPGLIPRFGPRFDPGWEYLLEKGTATHSSILAWRIPGREEPGSRLRFMGSQRIGHN